MPCRGRFRRFGRREAPIRCGFARTYEPAQEPPRLSARSPLLPARSVSAPRSGQQSNIRPEASTEGRWDPNVVGTGRKPRWRAIKPPRSETTGPRVAGPSARAIHRFQGGAAQDVVVGNLGGIEAEGPERLDQVHRAGDDRGGAAGWSRRPRGAGRRSSPRACSRAFSARSRVRRPVDAGRVVGLQLLVYRGERGRRAGDRDRRLRARSRISAGTSAVMMSRTSSARIACHLRRARAGRSGCGARSGARRRSGWRRGRRASPPSPTTNSVDPPPMSITTTGSGRRGSRSPSRPRT